jgi:NAD(P)-dependent dehydrogenase (short-subunit alcohol dehydrogenase family)
MVSTSKTVLITGGAQGIGKGLVTHFAAIGYNVFFVDRDAEAGKETAESISDAHFVCGDVTDSEVQERAVAQCLTSTGRLDALINNAGVSEFVPIDELTVESFRRILDTNLVSYFAWAKAATPALRDARGAIVNIASTRALQSEPHGEAYAASKGGVLALTHALAVSLGPKVRVNAISPGWIEVGPLQKRSRRREVCHSDTDRAQHPVGRVGTVSDIAYLAEYLCSERSEFITGQNHVVDGGMTKKMIYV